eukprot:m.32798 g.32798  ORF g.32798 m.32798 type:complete len:207 (+) comp8451_c0_seq2:180-800(+)
MSSNKKKLKGMSPEELEEYNKKQQRKGIIYLSRLPPYMKPAKIKHLMSQYGKVGRVFLKPEDEKIAKKRKKLGGNKKANFTEGWVEFEDKKLARRVAESLNGTRIAREKGSYYHDDMWTMLYLPKFKWHHLTERIAYENAVRQKRLEAEDAQVRRETNIYLENVDKAKAKAAILERKAEKRKQDGDSDETTKKKKKPKIRQRKPIE